MYTSGLANYCPLITNYPGQLAPPPAPPAPAPSPSPPPSVRLAFSVVTRASLFGIVGTAISSTTLATVTCTDTAATIRQSVSVPGLTFGYAGNVLTVAGTPTGNAAVYRVVVSYIASSDGATVLGSSEHEVTIANASQVLTVGAISAISGRVGQPLSVVLCTPTANFSTDIVVFGSTTIRGLAVTWVWNRATASGTLTLAGTPLVSFGPAGFNFVFSGNGQVLGSCTAACTITEAYTAPPPAPAPSPAPPPPAPSPPPVPAPAPAPGGGPDPYLSSVRVLMHFDDNPGLSVDQDLTFDERGNIFTNHGATQWTGAVGAAALFTGSTTRITGAVTGIDGLDDALTAECMVDFSASVWSSLSAAGDEFRFCPVISYTDATDVIVWALGFYSFTYLIGNVMVRTIRPTFYIPTSGRGQQYPVFVLGSPITSRPNRFVHLRGAMRHAAGGVGYSALVGVWFDGVPPQSASYYDGTFRVQSSGATIQLGGVCGQMQSYFSDSPSVSVVPFSGAIDEVRITTLCRDIDRINFGQNSTYGLPPTVRVIPWPNY